MTDRYEIANKLADYGFTACVREGVVCVNTHPNDMKKLAKIMKELGYKGSYGARLELRKADQLMLEKNFMEVDS